MKRFTQVLMDRLKPIPLRTDKVLHSLGVEPRRRAGQRWAPRAGGFGAGFVVGVGVGLFAAPKAGKELRTELSEAIASFLAKSTGTGTHTRDEPNESIEESTHSDRHEPLEVAEAPHSVGAHA